MVYPLVVTCNVINVTNPANTNGTAGTPFSEQFTQTGGNGTITWSTGSTLPVGITLDSSTGILSGTTTETGTFPITVTATDGNGCTGTSSTYNLTIACQSLSITNPAQTSVQAGVALNVTFTATGILGTGTWTETGALPTGITLSSTGVLSGTSNQVGTFPITVKVTDTNGCFTTSSYTLTVTCPTITVARTGGGAFPAGTISTAYVGQSVVAAGGSGTYTYAIFSGSLPTGLSLSAAGAISGTPTQTGTFTFVVRATDSSTSCTGDSATLSIAINPACLNDSYTNLVNNTQAVITGGTTTSPTTPFVALTGVIISNDLPSGGVAAVAGTFATTQSGSVTIAADGSFIYTPPVTASAIASDSFTYTISSDTGGTGTPTQATGTVNLTLAGRVWYVKNNVANGNGQSQSPFNSTANFTNGARATPDKPNDIIYIHTGDGTTLNHTSGITLLQNEQLIGQGVALVVNTNTLQAAGAKPLITNTAVTSDAVTLHDGNTIKGLTVTAATRDGIAGSTHAGLTIDTVTIQNHVTAGLHLTSMTGTVTITNTTFTGNAIGLDVDNGTAAITADNTNSITANAGQRSVRIQNRPAAAGNITIGAGITDNGTGILVNNNASGTIGFTGTQTMATTTNTAVALTTNTGATVNFTGTLGITTSTGTGFTATGGGTVGVSGTANITTGAAASGLNLNGVTSSGITFTSVTTTGATTGVSLTSLGNGNVTINGGNVNGGTTGYALSTLGTSVITLNNLTIGGVTPPTTAISGTNFGTLTISGTVNVSGVSALNLNTGIVSGTFNNVTSSGGTNGASLTSVSGTWGATAGTLTGASGTTFLVSGAAAAGSQITWGGNITQANGALVVSISGHNRTINFNGNVQTSGTGTGISLTTNTGTYNFNGATNTIAGSGGGIVVNAQTGGSVSFSSGTNITTTNTAAASFVVTNSSVNVTYSGLITQNSNAGKLLNIDTYSGGTLTMSNASGTALQGNVNGINGVISTLNNITGTVVINNLNLTSSNNNFNNTLVAITGTNTGGSITFNHLVLSATGTGHTGKGLTMVGNGTLTITATGGNSSIDVSSVALDLNGQVLGASAIQTLNSSGGANGIKLVSTSGGTLTITGGTIAGNTGSAFLITNGSVSVSYGGTITQNTAGQKAVDISGITGGTIALSGAIGSNGGNGVSVAGTGGTVNISGDMTLNNANSVFSATGAGLTVTATGTNNTIGATNAATTQAVNITCTIGSSGVTFKSVSQNGGAKAITVNGAGTLGTFSITGTGTTAGSGGTIQNTTGRGAEFISFNKASGNSVVLTNMTFNNNVSAATSPTLTSGTCGTHAGGGNATTCQAVLFFDTVTGVSVTNTTIDGTTKSSQGQGIAGNNVTNLSLTQVSVQKAGTEVREEGLKLVGISGTVTLDRCTFRFNQARGVYAEPFSGAMNMTVSGGTYGDNSAFGANAQQGILVVYSDTASGTVTVQQDITATGATFQNILNHAISVQNATNNTIALNVNGATFTACNAALDMPNGTPGNTGAYNFNITNNTMSAIVAQATVMNCFNRSTGTQQGSITGNTIGNSGVAGSGCATAGCDGIRLTQQTSSGMIKATVSNNFIHRVQESGIFALANAGTGDLSLVIQGNTITDSDNVGGSAVQPIHIESGASAGDTNFVCTVIGGATAAQKNTLSGANWLAGIRLRNVSDPTSTLKLSGKGAATAAAYLPTVNNMSGSAATVSTTNTISDDGTPCP